MIGMYVRCNGLRFGYSFAKRWLAFVLACLFALTLLPVTSHAAIPRIVVVDTDPLKNPDFTSLSAAIDAYKGTLDQPLEIRARASSGIVDVGRLSIDNYVTTPENNLTIVFEKNYVFSFQATANYQHAIDISVDHLTVDLHPKLTH